ncbi:MAG: hypothetical protein LBK13_13320 [Spirochaetales bacterium]|jgi:hypothetical protein|nr:hypothetical protein [Spirochaetales bacterium]
MKKNALFAVLVLLIGFVFVGCSDSDDGGNDFGDDGVPKSIKIIDFDDMDGTPPKVMFGIANAGQTAAIALSNAFITLSGGDSGEAEDKLFIADANQDPTGTKWTGTGSYRIFIVQEDLQNKNFPPFISKEKIKINSALTTCSFNDFKKMQDAGDWKGDWKW